MDTRTLKILSHTPTSYTDVMTVESSGRRTFFHQRGANTFLDVRDLYYTRSGEKLFHLGYLLLLDTLDQIYDDGTSGAVRVLDLEDSCRFKNIILPALPYSHFLLLNEFEAGRCTGIHLTSDTPAYDALSHLAI